MLKKICLSMMIALALPVAALRAADKDTGVEAEASNTAGQAHLRDGRPALAVEAFRKAISLVAKDNPIAAYYYKGLGDALLALATQAGQKEDVKKKLLTEAEASLRKSLAIQPLYIDVHNDLAIVLIKQGRLAEGKNEGTLAINDPQNPRPELTAYNLGKASYDEKNYAEAVNWYQSSISKNDALPVTHLGLADAFVAWGRLGDAAVALDAGLRTNPENQELLKGLGEVFLKLGRFEDARRRLEEAVKKDPVSQAGRDAAQLLKTLPRSVSHQ